MASEVSPNSSRKGKLPAALEPLTQHERWVIWRWTIKENGERDKPPFRADNPKVEASASNSSTWTTYTKAVAAAPPPAEGGIGYVLTDTDWKDTDNERIIAFDIDGCRDAERGELHPWASNLIDRAGSYTEITPSETGVRIIGWGKGKHIHRQFAVIEGMEKCELYRGATRYITMTGNQIGSYPLANIDAVMDATFAELEERKRKLDEQKRKLNGPGSPEDGGHHDQQGDG